MESPPLRHNLAITRHELLGHLLDRARHALAAHTDSRRPQVLKLEDLPQHSRASHANDRQSEALVRAMAEVDVRLHGPGGVDGVGVGEREGVARGGFEVDGDLVAFFEVVGALAVVDGDGAGDAAVEGGFTGEAGEFHEVVGELVEVLGGV